MIKLKLSHFDFKLPEELLRKDPLPNRDESRMMVVNRHTGDIEHRKFKDILDYHNYYSKSSRGHNVYWFNSVYRYDKNK